MNPLLQLRDLGQSVWLDYIRRGLILSGELARLVREDGLAGVTSNPAIFEKAISGSSDYASALAELASRPGLGAKDRFEVLAIRDIQDAAEVLLPVYRETARRDGYVSLEVAPELARDTEGTLAEARRLWKTVARENVMIKVPATAEGIPAIRTLLGEGINVNITLLFAREVYEQVAQAYIEGLEALAARGGDLARMASVASFFVSRIDTAVDNQLAERLKGATGGEEQERLRSLLGKVAIANAKLAYRSYKRIFSGPRWQALAAKGARTQRVLWASTGTKNPRYRDVLYVEELIGPDTVNTVPPATFDAFRDHGKPRASLEERVDEAEATLARLAETGISLAKVTSDLTEEAVRLFEEPFAKLLQAIEKQSGGTQAPPASRLPRLELGAALEGEVRRTLAEWGSGQKVARLWARDSSLWTGADESSWLGWLGVAEAEMAQIDKLQSIAAEVKAQGITQVALLGMGGSSLCPEVMRKTFGRIDGFPDLRVLDSTDPAQIAGFERGLDLKHTLFIVSSKSGTTLEPNIFMQYFLERTKAAVGADEAPKRFVAITDPGSKLHEAARSLGFRHVFLGLPTIGGRYSALSAFGVVPSALLGVDLKLLLSRAQEMATASAACVPPDDNPGVVLGAVIGAAARDGRDKLTIVASPGLAAFGAWLEQLLAESTGKGGRGIIPVDLERVGPPTAYGADRLFVHVRLESKPDPEQDRAVAALAQAGQPVVRVAVADPHAIGAEYFRWEIATAVAGSILGINPFDQPDVEASKVETKKLTSEYEKEGRLPEEKPFLEDQGIRLFADPATVVALQPGAGGKASLGQVLKAHLDRLRPRDYLALLAYVEMSAEHTAALQKMRHAVRDRRQVATCLGFGPRFLHSTGQAYKGGPNSGVFLQITCDDAHDLPVPGQKYSFGVVKSAQARGDLAVLVARGRRALRVHLGTDVGAGLARLGAAIEQALG